MFLFLYNSFGIYIKFETKRGSLVFLTGRNDHAFSFVSQCKHIRLFLHQLDTSLRLFYNVTFISLTVSPFVSRDESSTNSQFLTFLSSMCSGRSIINMQEAEVREYCLVEHLIVCYRQQTICRLHKHTVICLIGMTGRKG